MRGAYKKRESGFLNGQIVIGRKGNILKLTESTFKLGIRKNFFPVKVGKPWHRLLGKAMAAISLKRPMPAWIGLEATWTSGRCPCYGRGLE